MAFHVYVLHSELHNKIYVGMSSNLEKRIYAHNHLPKGWTRHFRPWRLVYKEEFPDKLTALKREKELKSHKGRDYIRNTILSQK